MISENIDTQGLLGRLALLDCCAISDALDATGLNGVLLGLRALSVPQKIVGRAITVTLGVDDGRASHRHLGTAAVEAGGPGSIIVVEHAGRTDVAGWGGILSLGARTKGIEGVIIDGACRDIDEAREMALPIYGLNGVPRTARGRIMEYGWNDPVTLCGVGVAPGDYILADGSGIAVIPEQHAEPVIKRAEKIARKESLMARDVRAGRPISEVMGSDYEHMLREG